MLTCELLHSSPQFRKLFLAGKLEVAGVLCCGIAPY